MAIYFHIVQGVYLNPYEINAIYNACSTWASAALREQFEHKVFLCITESMQFQYKKKKRIQLVI